MRIKPLIAAALLAAAASAQAVLVNFSGVTDSGPLVGATFDGSFSYAQPAAGFDGPVLLDSFTLNFNGQTYLLADGDLAPTASFSAGTFIGVDYVDADGANPGQRAYVALTAGFTQLSEAFFAYDTRGLGAEGFGSFADVSVVPTPSGLALALAALGLLGAAGRRRPALR